MSRENSHVPVQDENANARLTHSKVSRNSNNISSSKINLATAINVQSRRLPTVSSNKLGAKRPALSNLTNTSVSTSLIPSTKHQERAHASVCKSHKLEGKDIIESKETVSDDEKKISLKRSASEAATDHKSLQPDENLNKQPVLKKARKEYSWTDLDAQDLDDPLMVSEYVVEIFEYLSELEVKTLPDPTYLTWQTNIKPKMRSILVDWIVEVHLRFRLLPETLFLAINIMDRFMSKEVVQVDKLQLLATGSLFIAAKYEEVFSPSVKNYSYVTDGGYTEDDILGAERYILQVLEFNLSYPNPMNFLRRISKADDYDIETRTVGKYLLEITIMDHKCIGIKPSLCAASAMYLSRKMLSKSKWDGTLIHYSGGYTKEDMKHVIELIMIYLIQPVIHEEFFKKYASKKYMKSSILARQWAKKIEAEGIDIMED